MTPEPNNLSLLGISIPLKAGADSTRMREAVELVQKSFDDQTHRARSGQNKETLLILTALGLADELLQLKKQRHETDIRLSALLNYIDSTN